MNDDPVDSADVTDSEEEEEEAIIVTRPEEEIDAEDEADFDREYAKMMAESLESRKFDRKPTFDVPLPMRRQDRVASVALDNGVEEGPFTAAPDTPTGTMAFSLLTKRGNRQQVSAFSFTLKHMLMLQRPARLHCHQTPTSLSL